VVTIKPYAESFYKSKAWQQCRNGYFLSQHGICERCGGAGRIVHHRKYITPANINNPNVTLDWHNLELLCDECHQKEHQNTRNTAESVKFDANGDVIQSPHPMEVKLATKTTTPTSVNPDSPFSAKMEFYQDK
jgi:excinuclease UvrABC ATPase subunit